MWERNIFLVSLIHLYTFFFVEFFKIQQCLRCRPSSTSAFVVHFPCFSFWCPVSYSSGPSSVSHSCWVTSPFPFVFGDSRQYVIVCLIFWILYMPRMFFSIALCIVTSLFLSFLVRDHVWQPYVNVDVMQDLKFLICISVIEFYFLRLL